ncbi:unnamed protein product [Paramecium sonneborni]|uniref:RING-type domain-containing protein n=1 Tax=Paramecium sonneborni TaxID=65129 RepID=A0A8S1RFD2_9CILI|nr:unnamed protein product [Paramecium sonneborni]CAD8125752.1 unnamed protein product [Paramecium sonneborni]
MNSEIARLEELKQAEIHIIGLQFLTKEVNKKDQEIMQYSQYNQGINKIKNEQSQKDLEAEKQYQKEYLQALQQEKDKEVINGELQQHRQKSLKYMDNQKILYLSQILDLSSEFIIIIVIISMIIYLNYKRFSLYKFKLKFSKKFRNKQSKMNRRRQYQQFNNSYERVQEIKKKIQKTQIPEYLPYPWPSTYIYNILLNLNSMQSSLNIPMYLKLAKTKKTRNWFDDIPILVGVDEITQSEICAICLQEINDEKLINILNCNHYFHNECIKEWVLIKAECPTCRDIIHQ